MVQEEGTIFSPVWSQFNTSSGGISSSNYFIQKDLFVASKLVIVYFDFKIVAFHFTNFILFRREYAQPLFRTTGPSNSASWDLS